jgi:hypothetical protein
MTHSACPPYLSLILDTFHSRSRYLRYTSLIANASTLMESRRFLIGGNSGKIHLTDTVTLILSKEYPCHLVAIVMLILRIHRDVTDLGMTMALHGSMLLICEVLTSEVFLTHSRSTQCHTIGGFYFYPLVRFPLEVRARFKNKVGLEACKACKRRILIYCASANLPHYSTSASVAPYGEILRVSFTITVRVHRSHDARDALRVNKSLRLRQP